MVSIEQVKLLESRVIKTIDFVDQVTQENVLLKNKLESCQKRVDELEVLIQRFKEDQAKIEDSIVSALDRLNKFEDDIGTGGVARSKPEPAMPKKTEERQQKHAERHAEPTFKRTADDDDADGFVLKEKPYNPDEDGGEEDDQKKELEIF